MAAFNDRACWKLLSTCATLEGFGNTADRGQMYESVLVAGKHHQADSKSHNEGCSTETATKLGLVKRAGHTSLCMSQEPWAAQGGKEQGQRVCRVTDAALHAAGRSVRS